MEMDVFFADNSKDGISQNEIGFITALESIFDIKAFLCLLFLLPNLNSAEAREIPMSLIEIRENSKLDIIEYAKVQAMLQRADYLAKLQDGWDGVESHSINVNVIYKLKKALKFCTDKDIEKISLFPQANGDLYLDYTHNEDIAGITLSEDTAIFFRGTIDKLSEKGSFEFTPDELYKFICSLNKNA